MPAFLSLSLPPFRSPPAFFLNGCPLTNLSIHSSIEIGPVLNTDRLQANRSAPHTRHYKYCGSPTPVYDWLFRQRERRLLGKRERESVRKRELEIVWEGTVEFKGSDCVNWYYSVSGETGKHLPRASSVSVTLRLLLIRRRRMRVETCGTRVEKTDNAVELSGVSFYFPAARRSLISRLLKRLDGGGSRGPRTCSAIRKCSFHPDRVSQWEGKKAVLMDIIWWALKRRNCLQVLDK